MFDFDDPTISTQGRNTSTCVDYHSIINVSRRMPKEAIMAEKQTENAKAEQEKAEREKAEREKAEREKAEQEKAEREEALLAGASACLM